MPACAPAWLAVHVALPHLPHTMAAQDPDPAQLPGGLQLQGVLPQARGPGGSRISRHRRLQPPGCPYSSSSQAAATGGHCSITPARSRMNCFRSSQPPACALLLPTQHFYHPLRETLPYFSFSSSQKFPEPLEVPISISASPWGILQMPEKPWHPPVVGSALRLGCAVQCLKGKTETPLL